MTSVIDSESVNVNVKILNCSLGPWVIFCELCPEGYKSVELVREKPVALEIDGRERAGSFLVVPDGWYLETSQHHHPSLVPGKQCKGHCASVQGNHWVPLQGIVGKPDPFFLLNKTPV